MTRSLAAAVSGIGEPVVARPEPRSPATQDDIATLVRGAVLAMTCAVEAEVRLNATAATDSLVALEAVRTGSRPILADQLAGTSCRTSHDGRHVTVSVLGTGAIGLGEISASTEQPSGFRQEDLATLLRLGRWCASVLEQRAAMSERDAAVAAWLESEDRFVKGFIHSPVGMAVTDGHGSYVRANSAFAAMLGRDLEDVVGAVFTRFTHPDDLVTSDRTLEALSGGGVQTFEAEKRYLRPDGSTVYAHVTTTAVNGPDGTFAYAIHQLQDITERRAMEEQLRRTARLLADEAATLEMIARGGPLAATLERIARTVEDQFAQTRCALVITGESGEVLELASPTLESATATSLALRARGQGATSHDPGMWTTPIVAPGSGRDLGVLVMTGPWVDHPGENEVEAANRCIRLTTIALERSNAEEEIRHQALHDQLTGLPNRLLFTERLERVFVRRQPRPIDAAVLFLDLDRFKLVNDAQGHAEGDALLVAVARRLEARIRASDTVARFGGDEFVILCDGVGGRAGAEVVAAAVLGALQEPIRLGQVDVTVTASIGVAMVGRGHRTPGDVIRDADLAMYAAKEQGRARRVVFDAAMRARLVRKLDTERELRHGLDAGHFRLVYQPIIDLRDRHMVGCEALVRWQHPQRGLLAPGEFIDIAEECGLIEQLGTWVLRMACVQARRWDRLSRGGEPFTVAVNVSARQMSSPELPGLVAAALQDAGADPRAICLEITESVLMEDADAAAVRLQALRDLGVSISIDDFGTGYSSLSYLQRLPFDSLKIDRSFVAGVGERKGDRAIVGTVIEMAHRLSLGAVAEGVETLAQLEEVTRMGCDRAQGYIFSRPVTPRRLEHLATWWDRGPGPRVR